VSRPKTPQRPFNRDINPEIRFMSCIGLRCWEKIDDRACAEMARYTVFGELIFNDLLAECVVHTRALFSDALDTPLLQLDACLLLRHSGDTGLATGHFETDAWADCTDLLCSAELTGEFVWEERLGYQGTGRSSVGSEAELYLCPVDGARGLKDQPEVDHDPTSGAFVVSSIFNGSELAFDRGIAHTTAGRDHLPGLSWNARPGSRRFAASGR